MCGANDLTRFGEQPFEIAGRSCQEFIQVVHLVLPWLHTQPVGEPSHKCKQRCDQGYGEYLTLGQAHRLQRDDVSLLDSVRRSGQLDRVVEYRPRLVVQIRGGVIVDDLADQLCIPGMFTEGPSVCGRSVPALVGRRDDRCDRLFLHSRESGTPECH